MLRLRGIQKLRALTDYRLTRAQQCHLAGRLEGGTINAKKVNESAGGGT